MRNVRKWEFSCKTLKYELNQFFLKIVKRVSQTLNTCILFNLDLQILIKEIK